MLVSGIQSSDLVMHISTFYSFFFLSFSIVLFLLSIYAAKSLQSCPTLCDPIDGSPPGSPIPRIFQARTLKWVAISFSNAWKWKGKVKSLSRVWPSATPWTAAHQAPPSMGLSRKEYTTLQMTGQNSAILCLTQQCLSAPLWMECSWVYSCPVGEPLILGQQKMHYFVLF